MENVYYIVIPLIAALISGSITLAGVIITIKHENEVRKEETKKKEIEKNIKNNKKIIQYKPKLTATNNTESIKHLVEVFLLPYTKPKLLDEERMLFGYSDDIFNEDYWDKREIVLQNTGKRKITLSFLHIPYDLKANIYSKFDLTSWKCGYHRNYYSDKYSLPSSILPNDKIKLVVYFPKNNERLGDMGFDLYINDEDNNFWLQRNILDEAESDPEVVAPDTFDMHLKSEFNRWFIYDSFYYSNDAEKCFKRDISSMLEKKKQDLYTREDKQEKFVRDVNNGLIPLNFNLPLD